jgi:hypothetical protein
MQLPFTPKLLSELSNKALWDSMVTKKQHDHQQDDRFDPHGLPGTKWITTKKG